MSDEKSIFHDVEESNTDVGIEYTLWGSYDIIIEVMNWLHEHYPSTWGIEWTVDHHNRHDAINVVFNLKECNTDAALMGFKLRWL